MTGVDRRQLRVGTRGSALARAQSQTVADAFALALGGNPGLVTVTTHGDVSKASLATIGGQGVFVGALRQALLDGDCDIIVHSFKDLPTAPVDGITLAAVPQRAPVGDVLAAGEYTFATLPEGARIGTGSPRRKAQTLAQRPDLTVVDLRGNIDTRLAHVTDGELDGVILAEAGMSRLGKLDAVSERIDINEYPSAPAQGALAVEVRTSDLTHDKVFAGACASIDQSVARLTSAAERAVLSGLGTGCAAPLGASAIMADGLLLLHAVVYSANGATTIAASRATVLDPRFTPQNLADANELGASVAEELIEQGALTLIPQA